MRTKIGRGFMSGVLPAFVAVIGGALLIGCGDDGDDVNGPQGQTISNVIEADSTFSILDSALRTADLEGTLDGEGPFTLFAPTNAPAVLRMRPVCAVPVQCSRPRVARWRISYIRRNGLGSPVRCRPL